MTDRRTALPVPGPPDDPVDPDPAFAAALRERLRRALLQQPPAHPPDPRR